MPILEAMACGTPTVVADFSSLPEVAAEAGIVVNVADPQSVARRLMQLADDAAERDRLRSAGIRRAGLFTWDACVAKLADALRTNL